jgi:hypothetical protein
VPRSIATTVITLFAAAAACSKPGDRQPPAPSPLPALPLDAATAAPAAAAAAPAPGPAVPLTLVQGQDGACPRCLQVTGGALIWAGRSRIAQAAKDGTGHRELATDQNVGGDLAVDDTSIIWIEHGDGVVMTLARGAPDAKPVSLGTLGIQRDPGYSGIEEEGLAIDRDTIFANREGELWAVPRTPGARQRLLAKDAHGPFAVAAGRLYFITGDAQIASIPVAGGSIQRLGTRLPRNPSAMVIDGGRLFWTESVESRVSSLAIDGSEPAPTILVADASRPEGIAVAGDFVYFASARAASEGGSIRRVRRTGGPVEVIAPGEEVPGPVAADATAVYWILDDGAVRTLSR